MNAQIENFLVVGLMLKSKNGSFGMNIKKFRVALLDEHSDYEVSGFDGQIHSPAITRIYSPI